MAGSTFARAGTGSYGLSSNPVGRPPTVVPPSPQANALIAATRYRQQLMARGGASDGRGPQSFQSGAELSSLRGQVNADRSLPTPGLKPLRLSGARPAPLR